MDHFNSCGKFIQVCEEFMSIVCSAKKKSESTKRKNVFCIYYRVEIITTYTIDKEHTTIIIELLLLCVLFVKILFFFFLYNLTGLFQVAYNSRKEQKNIEKK